MFSKACASCGLSAVFEEFHDDQYSRGKWISSHTFGSGSAMSRLAKDSMSFGPLTAGNQYFWEVFEANMPVIEAGHFNAIVGTGPQYTAIMEAEEQVKYSNGMLAKFAENGKKVPTDLEIAANEAQAFVDDMSTEMTLMKNLGCSVFSVCLGQAPNSPGWFIWNDAEPSASTQAFVSIPVTARRNWGAQITNVLLGDSPIGCERGCGAIFDSGTSLIAAPPEIYQRVLSEFQAMNNDCSKIDQLPSLTFEVNSQRFVLPPHTYVGEVVGSVTERMRSFFPNHRSHSTCRLLLMQMGTESQMGPMWIMGMPFFRQYYTTFRRSKLQSDRRMYFAHAAGNCTVDASMHYHEHNVSSISSWLRKIDISKVNIPRWLENMALKSYHVV